MVKLTPGKKTDKNEGVRRTGREVKPFTAWKEQGCLSLLHLLLEAGAYWDDSANEDIAASNGAKNILWKLKKKKKVWVIFFLFHYIFLIPFFAGSAQRAKPRQESMPR